MRAQKGNTARMAKCTERISILPEICIERERYYTNSYQEAEGEPPCLRQARAFAKILDHMNIQVYDGELIVGCPYNEARGGAVLSELNAQWL